MRLNKEEFHMSIAETVKERSTCSRLQVGAVVMDKNMMQMAIGYNGNYKGGPNGCDSNEPGKCGCIHGEVNALIKPVNFERKVMFITDSPCITCSKLIINAGIERVYYKNEYRNTEGKELLAKNNIEVYKL